MTKYNFEKSFNKIKSIDWKNRFNFVDIDTFKEIDKIYYELFPFFFNPK